MALDKLYYVYGLDTACLYNDEEMEIEKKVIKARVLRSRIRKLLKSKKAMSETQRKKYINIYKNVSKYVKSKKTYLKETINKNVDTVRTVRNDKIYYRDGTPNMKRRVSTFDSDLVRCFDLKQREFNTDIVIIKVYFFEVAKSIIRHGFYMNGEKYVFFSASAGQIRTKKLVAVKESLLVKNWNRLTAGLTIEMINQQGGMNINKFLAYLALVNSATDLYRGFNIDRCIVVDDFENEISGNVDYINRDTYEITRETRKLPFSQTDGIGMILPCLSRKNFMIRLPWVKGLLAVFDYVKFIEEKGGSPIVKDVYGDEHNILKENIQIIFTKSQFKMWKFYKNWEEYKENFKKYGCTAGKCNVEPNYFPKSEINYQMIQTLSDLTDEEILSLSSENNEFIHNLATDKDTMLLALGAIDNGKERNGFQKCLEKYPELLSDSYCRNTIRSLKDKLEKDLWSARFRINAKYTFAIPDLYAFCEHLFLGIESPEGLLKDGEVCCKLFKNGEKLDCLRSPHLYIEHPIRKNNTEIEWFSTNAIYVSCHDLISRVVQMDYDGDKLLVTNNEVIVNAAERNNHDKNVVPLFYDMGKANAEQITPDSLYKGLILAFNGGNIGTPSNHITKLWNCGKINDEVLTVIKWLCMEVNFTIDYSKTLYKPERPEFANNIITKYTKGKVPHFFMFAKQKEVTQVNRRSDCVVDRIEMLFPRCKLNFNFKKDNIGKFDFHVLMSNAETEYNPEIAENYKKITSKLNLNIVENKVINYLVVIEDARQRILEFPASEDEIVNTIIIDLFEKRKSAEKRAFWILFGDIVYRNVSNNITSSFAVCPLCLERYYKNHGNQKYCLKCRKKISLHKGKYYHNIQKAS